MYCLHFGTSRETLVSQSVTNQYDFFPSFPTLVALSPRSIFRSWKMTDNYASFEPEVRNQRKGRNLIVSRTKTPGSAGYTGDRAGKVSGLQILPLWAYRAPGLACLKNNSKRRAASRLLTLERIRRANNHEPAGSERKRGRFTDTNTRLDVWQSVIFKSSTF